MDWQLVSFLSISCLIETTFVVQLLYLWPLTLSGLGKGGFHPALCILIYILLTGDFQGLNVCFKFIIMYFKRILFLKHKFFITGDPPPAPQKIVTPKKIEYVSGYRSAEWQLTLPYPYHNPTCFRISYNF